MGRTPAKKRQQLVGCTSWRGKTKFVLRRECFSSLAAQRESAKPAELVVQQARYRACCPAGGSREARARLPRYSRHIFGLVSFLHPSFLFLWCVLLVSFDLFSF